LDVIMNVVDINYITTVNSGRPIDVEVIDDSMLRAAQEQLLWSMKNKVSLSRCESFGLV